MKRKVVKKRVSSTVNKSLKKVDLSKPIHWTEKMSVEEKNIDAQHQNLVKNLNLLLKFSHEGEDITKIREALHFLESYVTEHFGYEEAYMKKIKYPGLKAHQKVHAKLVEYFLAYRNRLTKKLYNKENQAVISIEISDMLTELRNYLADWLVNHMLGDDQGFHQYAKAKKLTGKNYGKEIWEEINIKPKLSLTPPELEKISSEKKKGSNKKSKSSTNISEIASQVRNEMIGDQRDSLKNIPDLEAKKDTKNYVVTSIEGFDELLIQGIPKGTSLIIAGGAGSGKTILCLQTLINKAKEGKKCLYMTLEEDEDRLVQHMEGFGWNPRPLIKKGNLKIIRMNPFDITRNVDALLAKQKGELLIEVNPVLLPKDYAKPDFVVIDSLTAIASAFVGKEDSYRIYIEQLFRFLEKTGATSFLITETEQVPKIFSQTGVEEFLADGVIVLYSLKHGNVRENAIEILKLRGAAHQKKIVAMQITSNGVVVYPEQEVFSEI
jgi:hemerythrin-like metal-binding protein